MPSGGARRRAWLASVSSLALLALPLSVEAGPEAVSYRVSLEHPAGQLVEVELRLRAALPLELVMPVWVPGSYRERHFIRNLKPGPARTAAGRPLRWVRSGRDRFLLGLDEGTKTAPQALQIRYSVYAGNLADDASHLDDEHAHLCGPTVFLMAPALRGAPHRLQLVGPRGFRIATPLDADGGAGRFRARDYDELVDAPIELGRFASAEVRVGASTLQLAWHDASGRGIPRDLPEKLRRIAELHARWLGPPPYARYLLVIHTVPGQDYQGLEHASGASLVVPASVLSDRDDYDDLLYVIAHEHLHVWNGKRLRPSEHARYDYSAAQPTRLLWWFEGVTDYLARRTLLGIGHWRAAKYLRLLAQEIGRVQVSPQRLWRSLSDISYEAFWPPRDPGEPGLTYYSKGHVVALLLDLELRARSRGRADLLAVLKRLLARPRVALTRGELDRELAAAAGSDLGPLLAAWVERPGELAYAAPLGTVGLRLLERRLARRPELGFAAELVGNELLVQAVARGGPAEKAGLVVGDRVLAINESRPHAGWYLQLAEEGVQRLRTSRRGSVRELSLRVRSVAGKAYELAASAATPEVSARRAAFLGP